MIRFRDLEVSLLSPARKYSLETATGSLEMVYGLRQDERHLWVAQLAFRHKDPGIFERLKALMATLLLLRGKRSSVRLYVISTKPIEIIINWCKCEKKVQCNLYSFRSHKCSLQKILKNEKEFCAG